jgi:twitching motility protein PilT
LLKNNMDIRELLNLTVTNKASDLHLLVGNPPTIRIDGVLNHLTNYQAVTTEEMESMIFSIISSHQKEILLANKEIDFSFSYGKDQHGSEGRFRVNIYYQRGHLSGSFRYLEPIIRTIEELHLPKICHQFANLKQGFILVTGPTGHGKSTTLASMINEINQNRAMHILTIEDPIEYVYPNGKSLVSQRSALREDPDVVLIGEMRDPETISSAITIAETGHLVFSTLHTNSAAQTIDRIIDSFPSSQQPQIRIQLAATLKGIISQRLLPQINGGRIPAVEVLIGNNAVATNIRDGKTHLIDSIIETSQDAGMISLESSLSSLVMTGSISLETAKSYAARPDDLMRMVA